METLDFYPISGMQLDTTGFVPEKACDLEKDQQAMAHGLILFIYIYIIFFKN